MALDCLSCQIRTATGLHCELPISVIGPAHHFIWQLGALILFTGFIWSAVSKSNTSFTISRIYQGVGMAPYEALVTATIGDCKEVLFFYAFSSQSGDSILRSSKRSCHCCLGLCRTSLRYQFPMKFSRN